MTMWRCYGSRVQALVCQIVFVNNADDASGNFRFHAADGRVWSQRKTFKEVVGIPIRYFDASIAFVSCNLSSPGNEFAGSQRSVQEKHAVASSLIHSFGMDVDRAAVDFPNLYHHTILSGNLNYDVELPQQRVLNLMDQAFKAECLKQATDTAIDTKLKPVGSSSAGRPRQSLDRSPSPTDAHQNANVPVEWSLLYFKSRNSLGRSSNVSASSEDALGLGDTVYREIYSSCDDNLPFTLLQSPQSAELQHPATTEPPLDASMLSNSPRSKVHNTTVPECEPDVQIKIAKDSADGSDLLSPELLEEKVPGSSSWFSFLDGLFPTQHPTAALADRVDRSSSASSSATTVRRSTASGRNSSLASNSSSSSNTNPRGDGKKPSDLLSKSELVAGNAVRKWKELLRFDELRAGIEAKEVFCGFEEPSIQFLPSYPRQVGTSASFASLAERSCRDLFLDADAEPDSASYPAPAYKDRVLAHSLEDTKQRLRNVAYWLCEEVTTSTHKPVCSLYELEIDRFFSYKMDEAARRDFQHNKHALRDKTGVQEFKLKLVNLDANIWTTEAPRDAGLHSLSTHSTSRHHRVRRTPHPYTSPGARTSTSGSRGNGDSTTSSCLSDSVPPPHARPSGLTKKHSVTNLVDRVLGKDRTRLSTAASSRGAPLTPNLYSDFSSDAEGVHPLAVAAGDRLSTLSTFHLELVPVEPVSITTVFPLPSEDLYALQRKVYEVAHSVQNGFQSSSKDEDVEESLLALTNCRTVAWTDAGHQGLTHTAITKAVNGVVHIAVTITAEKGHGGQGVLCIQESDLLAHATPVFSEAQPIPFDVTLTWGGKHVGYLHGDILSSL